ncbi:MAG: DUF6867 family protein [Alphaproteobacteria bacterium]
MDTGLTFFFDLATLLVISVIMFGFLSYMTGANAARNWQSPMLLIGYCALLAIGERFMAHTIVWHRFYILLDVYVTDEGMAFGFDAHIFVSFAICVCFGLFSYYGTKASLMVRQYPWLFERAGLFSWRSRD